MFAPTISFILLVLGTLRDLVPIIAVIAVFQLAVLNQPFPNLIDILIGLMFVMLGLALFVKGLEMGLFPLGEGLAQDFARKGSLFWLLFFSFALGFGTTVAEPALIAIAAKAARTAAQGGVIEPGADAINAFALRLRYTVALSAGAGIALGVLRIIKGWPVHWLIICGYVIAVASDSARRRPLHHDPRAQSADRRLRPDRFRLPDADPLRARFRHVDVGGRNGNI